jgi:CO/xanthine dehydrogenase FAD-binding subunit
VPLCDFFTGAKKTVLREGELLKTVLVPQPDKCSGSAYIKYTRRNAMDLALFGVSCYIALNAGLVKTARIALTTAAPTPMRATDAEAFLIGKNPGEAVLKEAAQLAAHQARPRSSWRSSAEFRTALAGELAFRVTSLAAKRAKGTDDD